MPNLLLSALAHHFDHIETWLQVCIILLQPQHGCTDDALLLCSGHKFPCLRELLAFTGLDLYEHNKPSLLGNQVNLSVAAGIILTQNLVSFFL